MTFDEVEQIFRGQAAYWLPISEISKNDNAPGDKPFCDIATKAFAYDKYMQKLFIKPPCSIDAISFKNSYVNFIEFKDAVLGELKGCPQKISSKTKVMDNIRLKIAESLHYIQKVMLKGHFLKTHKIKSRFILVYSEKKNRDAISYWHGQPAAKQSHKEMLNNQILNLA